MRQHAVQCERAEHRFRRDLWSLAPDDAVTESGVRMREFGPVLATMFAELPNLGLLNLVQGAAEPGATAGGDLAAAIDWMEEWEVDHVVPVPIDRPEASRAEQWLSWHDYEQGFVMRRYMRPAVPPLEGSQPAWVEVYEHPPCEDEEISYLATEGIGLPDIFGVLLIGLPCLDNWRCYVAMVDGELAATGSMMVDAGIATLGLDATLPWARGRGCQRALLTRRLLDAAADPDCHAVQAFACDTMGRGPSTAAHNLHSSGFLDASKIVCWQSPPRASR